MPVSGGPAAELQLPGSLPWRIHPALSPVQGSYPTLLATLGHLRLVSLQDRMSAEKPPGDGWWTSSMRIQYSIPSAS